MCVASGDDDWDRNDKVATDHFWLTVDKLEPSTAYEVRVVSLPNDGDNGLLNFKPSNRLRFNTIGGSFPGASCLLFVLHV